MLSLYSSQTYSSIDYLLAHGQALHYELVTTEIDIPLIERKKYLHNCIKNLSLHDLEVSTPTTA